jgi:hypothetical protein
MSARKIITGRYPVTRAPPAKVENRAEYSTGSVLGISGGCITAAMPAAAKEISR